MNFDEWYETWQPEKYPNVKLAMNAAWLAGQENILKAWEDSLSERTGGDGEKPAPILDRN